MCLWPSMCSATDFVAEHMLSSTHPRPQGAVTARNGGADPVVDPLGRLVPRRPLGSLVDVPHASDGGGRLLVPLAGGSSLADRSAHLSTSPTTKNIDPRIATMSATSVPGSSTLKTCTLLKEAERSLSRHGVFSPRDTR